AVSASEDGVFDMRIEVAKALGAIGDRRGIKPVADRLKDPWDANQAGLIDALVAFGPQPELEDAMIAYLRGSGAELVKRACKVLEKVGTWRSLSALLEIIYPKSGSHLARAEARAAYDSINQRHPGEGKKGDEKKGDGPPRNGGKDKSMK